VLLHSLWEYFLFFEKNKNGWRYMKKYDPAHPLEFTALAIGIGIVLAILMTAANVYLGLYAGMTVSASIPAAVVAMAIYRGILRRNSILESNIVQTLTSAGESLAAGVIYTIPALLLVGVWQDFKFWPTTLIAVSGGLLGVIFMIPLRKALIVEDKDLRYPEGVACASVLQVGESTNSNGFILLLKGILIGGIFKIAGEGFKIFTATIEKAVIIKDRVFYMGGDTSPLLVSIGYIVGIEIAILMFIGGFIGWCIVMPMSTIPAAMSGMDPLEVANLLWSSQIRYLGVGAMLVGGIWSIIGVRKGLVHGIKGLRRTLNNRSISHVPRTDQDINVIILGIIFLVNLVIIAILYQTMIHHWGHTILTTIMMGFTTILFVAVSSYISGLVGGSNNPVSGMTITALLISAIFFLLSGFTGNSAILASLGIAAVVCCATCTACDCSQDLKTGYLVGASPKYQQYAEMIGVIIPAFIIAPILTLLHKAYGIGTGLKAPQATLFASISKAIFGDGNLPYDMVVAGIILGLLLILGDTFLKRNKSRWRLHVMPVAVGIYLPFSLSVPMVLGALIKVFVDKRSGKTGDNSSDNGTLLGSGLIAGESIMGVILAGFVILGWVVKEPLMSAGLTAMASLVAILIISYYFYLKAREK
jgi:putative OPT family oligopeptide transporter